MKGKWALGIPPRHFTWILKNKLAICERPGGYASNHRRVRRQEEIIWLREQRFDCVISLITSPHNLHNYEELGVQWRHRPFNGADDGADALLALLRELQELLRHGNKVVVHRDELGDHVVGLMAGYLLWAGLVESGPEVITVIERLTQRQLGPVGRELVAQAEALSASSETASS
ncbi:MAG TPA: hypothetical protein VGQ20_06160 [Acidimicrobiales bacterium]|jgi:hypothetical protein|nr:hypothetical protein [Acidimicrobiales bacterium]